jgi:hypothetical protein
MEQVIACIESYFGDIEEHIMESHFKKLVRENIYFKTITKYLICRLQSA